MYCVFRRWRKCEYGAKVETSYEGKAEVLGKKPVSIQHLLPQITNGLGCDQIRSSRLQTAKKPSETLHGHNLCSVNTLILIESAAFLDVTPWTSIEKLQTFRRKYLHTLCTLKMGQKSNLKNWWLSTNLHVFTSQNTRKLTIAVAKTSTHNS